jgi:hypothetical protein
MHLNATAAPGLSPPPLVVPRALTVVASPPRSGPPAASPRGEGLSPPPLHFVAPHPHVPAASRLPPNVGAMCSLPLTPWAFGAPDGASTLGGSREAAGTQRLAAPLVRGPPASPSGGAQAPPVLRRCPLQAQSAGLTPPRWAGCPHAAPGGAGITRPQAGKNTVAPKS